LKVAIGTSFWYWYKKIMKPYLKRYALHFLLAAGLLVRIPLLGLPGTRDLQVDEIWGVWGLQHGVTHVYYFDDLQFMTRAFMYLEGAPHPSSHFSYKTFAGDVAYLPDYPPLSTLYFTALVGLCKILQGGDLHTGWLLNACFNASSVLAGLAIAVLIVMFARRESSRHLAWATAAFWLNPFVILDSPVLGYVDNVYTLFGLASLILLYQRRYSASLFLLASSCLIKPQGALLLPIVAVVVISENSLRSAARLAARFILFCLLPFLPFAFNGTLAAAVWGPLLLARTPYLSSQQANLWWLVSWATPAARTGHWEFLKSPVPMLSLSTFRGITHLDPRPLAFLLWAAFLFFTLRALVKELKAGNRLSIFWAASLSVFGYTMLSLYPHENHFFAFFVYALPLLALRYERFLRFYAGLSVVFGLNLYFFDGLGRGTEAWADYLRLSPRFDLTVVVALANLVFFMVVLLSKDLRFSETRRERTQHVA
jgi:hypothetical protein